MYPESNQQEKMSLATIKFNSYSYVVSIYLSLINGWSESNSSLAHIKLSVVVSDEYITQYPQRLPLIQGVKSNKTKCLPFSLLLQ